MSISMALPAKPTSFHGRDKFVNGAVELLAEHVTARIAVLGPGGMGKTTIALALLHDPQVVKHFGGGRLFLSCEALVDVDAIVVSFARLLGLPASRDLLAAVTNQLAALPRVLVVLDNLETVWLVDGAPVAALDELVGQLAQIPSLSLIITCRGIILPQLVEWSNADSAALEPFSLEAALETFQDKAGRRLTQEEENITDQLLNAVDRLPLAVSLLGQLVRRGNTVAELLARWNREHSALLQTHGAGRINNVEVSIEVSITKLCAADESRESLQLLALCSMLPDGLRPDVFEKLRPHFKRIDRARDNLTAYALANLGADRILKTLSPIRHLVLERYPAPSSHRDALHSIYFDIAGRLPWVVSEHFKSIAAVSAPEMNNLSSLLFTLVSQPSQQIVDSVIRFTHFAFLQRPTMTVASALLSRLDPHPDWKARCLLEISDPQIYLGDQRGAIDSLTTAAQLFLEASDQLRAAWCTLRVADPYRSLGEYDLAETAVKKSQAMYAGLGDEFAEAYCRLNFGLLMLRKQDYPAALEHLTASRQTFGSLGESYANLECSESLGLLYLSQGNLESAGAELEVTYAAFMDLGHPHHTAQSLLYLGIVRWRQGNFALAEKLLGEAEAYYNETGDRKGLARCLEEFGKMRHGQERYDEAITCFDSARLLYEAVQMQQWADECRKWVERLQSTVHMVNESA